MKRGDRRQWSHPARLTLLTLAQVPLDYWLREIYLTRHLQGPNAIWGAVSLILLASFPGVVTALAWLTWLSVRSLRDHPYPTADRWNKATRKLLRVMGIDPNTLWDRGDSDGMAGPT